MRVGGLLEDQAKTKHVLASFSDSPAKHSATHPANDGGAAFLCAAPHGLAVLRLSVPRLAARTPSAMCTAATNAFAVLPEPATEGFTCNTAQHSQCYAAHRFERPSPQAGPHAGRAVTAKPTAAELLIPPAQFRVLLLRRLRLPLQPVSVRHFRCPGFFFSRCRLSARLPVRAGKWEGGYATTCDWRI